MVDAGLFSALRDCEVDSRIIDHPLRVIRFAHRRISAEKRRIKADARFEILDCNMYMEAFHAFAFLRELVLVDKGAQSAAPGPQAAPSTAQQFSVRNPRRRFITAKLAE